MREKITTMIAVGQPNLVKFNFGVVGVTGAGKRTFAKALTEPYDLNGSHYQVDVFFAQELTNESVESKHRQWLDACKIPTTDEQRNQSDNRVHCIFYLFTPHQILPEDVERIQQLQGLAPIVPVLAKADAMTPEELQEQLLAVKTMMHKMSQNAPFPAFFDFEESALTASQTRNIFGVFCDVLHHGQRVYPWGTANSHDETLSDLRRLQRLVFESGSISRLRALTQQMSIHLYAQDHNKSMTDWQPLVWVCSWGLAYMKWVKTHRDAGDQLPFLLNWLVGCFCGLIFQECRCCLVIFLQMPFQWWYEFHFEPQKK